MISIKKSKVKNKLFKIIYNICIIFAFLCPYFKLGDFSLNSAFLFITFPVLLYFLLFLNKTVKKEFYIFLGYYCFIFLVLLLNQIIGKGYDFRLLKLTIAGILIFFAADFYYLIGYDLYGKTIKFELLKLFVFAIFFNSLISLLCIFIVPFREFFYTFISLNELVEKYYIKNRYSGFVYTGFSFLSTVNSFAIIISILLYEKNNIKLINEVIIIGVIFLHIIFVGRTGLITLGLGIILLFIKTKNYEQKKRFRKLIITSGIIITLIFLALLPFINMEKFIYTLKWSFEFFVSFTENGKFSSTSTEGLKHQILIPEKPLQLLFGSGNYDPGYVHSDIGYIQILNGGGLFVLIILFGIFVYTYYISKKIKDDLLGFPLLYISICILIINVKDLYYVSYTSYSLLISMILIAYIRGKNENLRNNSFIQTK